MLWRLYMNLLILKLTLDLLKNSRSDLSKNFVSNGNGFGDFHLLWNEKNKSHGHNH